MTAPVQSASVVVQAIGDAITAAMVEDLAAVQVLDAVDPIQAYAEKSVTVGGTWDPDEQSFVFDETVTSVVVESGGGRRRVETTTVECIAYSGSGNKDFAGHRAAVGQITAAIAAALRAIGEIGGVAARARIGAERWAQGGDGNGTLAMAMLTVEVVRLL